MKYRSAGFTLIEILIALFIFAILGTIAAIGLHSVIETHQRVQQVDQQLQNLTIAQTLLRHDVSQIVDRSIIDADGHQQPAVLASGNNAVEFTHGGLMNPFGVSQRSDLQRVKYAIINKKLIRYTWAVLDRVPQSKALQRVLLTNVMQGSIQFLDSKNEWVSEWPPRTGTNVAADNSVSHLPRAIKIVLMIKQWGQLTDIMPIPSRGYNASVVF